MMRQLALLISDLVAFFIAFLAAYIFRELFDTFDKTITQTFYSIWWAFPIVILAFLSEGLYSKKRPFWLETRYIIKSLTVAFLIVFSIVSLAKLNSDVSRFIVIACALCSIFTFPIARKIIKKTVTANEAVVIIGSGESAVNCAEAILQDKYLGYKLVGFLDDTNKKQMVIKNKIYKIFGKPTQISKLASVGIKTAIIAKDSNELSMDLIAKLHSKVKKIYFAPDVQGVPLANTESLFLFENDIFLLGIKNNLESDVSQFTKRVFDIFMSIITLPVIVPVLIFIAFLIKKDDGENIIFSQTRMGQDKKPFKCYKFRTMKNNSDKAFKEYLNSNPELKQEWELYKKLKGDDPRVTKVGKFLRKTSLDELPQILNIIKGEMSFVGPRPYLFSEEKDMLGLEDIVLTCKPGITGFWQISGRNNLEFSQRVKLDSWYVSNWSLWLDIVILFKTVKVVLKREGAY